MVSLSVSSILVGFALAYAVISKGSFPSLSPGTGVGQERSRLLYMQDALEFIQRDYDALAEYVDSVAREIRRVQGETAESTEQTSETWHDNFMFEEGERQMLILSERLANVNDTLARAVVVEPRADGSAGVGNVVEVIDETTGETRAIEIGSYLLLEQRPGIASYASPLGKLLYDARVGDVRAGVVGSTDRRFRITSIS